MNTLQLYISKSAGSFVSLAEINPTDEGRRAAADMKAAVSTINYPPSAKLIFYIIANVAGGYAIHIVRTIPPTRPNHLDATVFVDKNLDIMAEDLEAVIEKVSEIISAKAVTEGDMNELRQLFAYEYDTRDKAPRIKASRGNDFAVLSYGTGRSLDDIISQGLYRPEWSDYRGVILLDEATAPFPNSLVDLDEPEDEPEETDEDHYDGRPDKTDTSSRQSHTYVFSLPVATPDGRSSLEFEIECSKPLRRSPVAGFEIVGKPSEDPETPCRLKPSHSRNLFGSRTNWIWGAAGLCLGLLIMWIASPSDSPHDSYIAESAYQQPATPATGETAPADDRPKDKPTKQSSAAPRPTEATFYLDNNRIWRRDDMEKIDALQGLFDDLNNYRFDMITGKWAETLAASKNFARVVRAANGSVSKKSDPRRSDDHSPSYNREGDNNISWLSYTYWIDP